MPAGEVGPQLFAGDELIVADHCPSVAALAAREPGQWAFTVVDNDIGDAAFGHDRARRQRKMLRAMRIDRFR